MPASWKQRLHAQLHQEGPAVQRCPLSSSSGMSPLPAGWALARFALLAPQRRRPQECPAAIQTRDHRPQTSHSPLAATAPNSPRAATVREAGTTSNIFRGDRSTRLGAAPGGGGGAGRGGRSFIRRWRQVAPEGRSGRRRGWERPDRALPEARRHVVAEYFGAVFSLTTFGNGPSMSLYYVKTRCVNVGQHTWCHVFSLPPTGNHTTQTRIGVHPPA
jgi:hypothetical protein